LSLFAILQGKVVTHLKVCGK